METLHVQFKGQTKALALPQGAETTWAQLQQLLEIEFHVPSDAQRVFFNKKRVGFETGDTRTLGAIGFYDAVTTETTPPRIMLMAGASKYAIDGMKNTQEQVDAEMRIRANRRVVSIGRRNKQVQAKDAVSTDYRFHAIEVLENFPDAHRARNILEQLANDRGILAVMAKHKWSVGCLAEMYPDGKVGVDPVCVLGLNQNKGQKILLRLRTDDLQGFRKFLTIKKVLFHELSHNVHSDHDSEFYQLMRLVERECNELDWSNSGGRAVGGEGSITIIPDHDELPHASGQRLGGGATTGSRLLRDTNPPAEDLSSHATISTSNPGKPTTPPFVPPALAPADAIVDESIQPMGVDIPSDSSGDNLENRPAIPTEARSQRPEPTPLFDASFSDYQPSERELRMQQALETLRTRYAADAVSNAASLLHKILSNIVQHADDEKYRTIRKTNRLFQLRLAGFPECLEFLQAVGFQDEGESVVLTRNDPALLWMGRSFLDVLLLHPSQ